jgi:hypothetical protein
MKTTLIALATAAALGVLAGCDRAPETNQSPSAASGASSTPPSTPQSNTPSTPANAGTPSAAEKREGSNPTQGQVDPKEPEQHKDFQHKGDAAGPKPGG